jgi:hypothetical protein
MKSNGGQFDGITALSMVASQSRWWPVPVRDRRAKLMPRACRAGLSRRAGEGWRAGPDLALVRAARGRRAHAIIISTPVPVSRSVTLDLTSVTLLEEAGHK